MQQLSFIKLSHFVNGLVNCSKWWLSSTGWWWTWGKISRLLLDQPPKMAWPLVFNGNSVSLSSTIQLTFISKLILFGSVMESSTLSKAHTKLPQVFISSIPKLTNPIEMIALTMVYVQCTEWEKSNIQLGKGVSFHMCHIYQGKLLIKLVIISPVYSRLSFRLYSLWFMTKNNAGMWRCSWSQSFTSSLLD